MMRVFLDTEFTDFHEPRLISVGLVTEAGQVFYAEVERSAWCAWQTEFVSEQVVPQLSRDGERGESRSAIGERLGVWLARFVDFELLIVVDFPTDWDLFKALLEEVGPWPGNLSRTHERFDPWAIDQTKGWGCVSARAAFYERHCLGRHHALNDARALGAAWWHAEKRKGRAGC